MIRQTRRLSACTHGPHNSRSASRRAWGRCGATGHRQEAYEQMFPHPHQEVLDRLAVPEERIATLPHETLVIHGREDGVIPLGSAVRLLELIGRAELHVFGQCGHWTQFEHPERFNTVLSAFLNR